MKTRLYILLLITVGFLTTVQGQTPPFTVVNCTQYYYDLDGDGYGDPNNLFDMSSAPVKMTYVFTQSNKIVCDNTDCDDTDAGINPNTNWATFTDGDGDGFVVINAIIQQCTQPSAGAVVIDENAVLQNFSYLQLDCDDSSASLNQSTLYYRDIDNDGFGDINDVIMSCSGSSPAGYVTNAGDWCVDTFGQYNGCPDTTDQTSINQNKNYVHSIAYQKPYKVLELTNGTIPSQDKIEQVTYFDGMGRAQMQVAIGQSPDGRDIKTIISYDNYGRAATTFLPYVDNQVGGNFSYRVIGSDPAIDPDINEEIKQQQQFYHNKYPNEVGSFTTGNGGLTMLQSLSNLSGAPQTLIDNLIENAPENGLIYPSYSTQIFDIADRPTQVAAPGKDWSLEFNHTIKMEYDLNDSSLDAVKRYDVTHPFGQPEEIQLVSNGLYPSDVLFKTITKDENWKPSQTYATDHTTEEFKNKSGQVLLKRTYNGTEQLDTYYIYDDFGNLTYVLSPEASDKTTIGTTELDQLCYQYKYDHRNRLIEKKIPAKGWEYIVYDALDRPVLTQDANLALQSKWLFTKYDGLGRVVYTGIYTVPESLNPDRVSMQGYVDANTTLFESKSQSAMLIGDTSVYYSNGIFPSVNIEVLTVSYYDDYNWDTGNSYEANYNFNGSTGVTATGVTHQKTSGLGASWTNSGFDTQGAIEGDGYIQYTITQTDNQRVMVGLTDEATASDIHYDSIDYAIYTGYGTDKRVRVYKDGVLQSIPVIYCAIGDTFRVERAGNQILFKQNGTTFFSMTTSFMGPLVGDGVFYDPNTAIENVYIGYSVLGQDFTSNVKGLATGGKVRVLGTNNWISSVSYYDEKGRVIHGSSTNDYLNTSDAVSSLLDFTGKVLKTHTTHKKSGNDPVVSYDEYVYDTNNRLLYQTKQINTDAKELIARNHYDELGQLTQKQVGGSLPSISTYSNLVNVSQNKELLTKTSVNAWNGGVSTATTISGDGYVSYNVTQANKTMMVGLSDVVGDSNYTSIKYAIYTNSAAEVHIRDNGSVIWDVATYYAGDNFKVERRGNQIYYLQNNQTIYISDTVDNGAPLLGDVSMFSTDSQISDLVLVDLESELQEVDYTYNVRGWLKGINDVNTQGNDLFSFALTYNDIADPAKQLFNGNISSTLWKTKGQDSSLKSYVYDYDALNRITEGISNTGNYDLKSLSYDLNGNIEGLLRTGHTDQAATVFGDMDNLSYTYQGNQLLSVSDASGVDFGFKDGNTVGNDYSYDVNGNMVTDKNKGITSISYNHLNLPVQITFDNESTISYIYDASGVKQEKIVNNSSLSSTQHTYYAGSYVYNKQSAQSAVSLTFFNSEEGYIEPEFDPGKPGKILGYNYTYQYKDHLGNIRLSYEDLDENGTIDPLTEIKEENHYYPFGLKHKGYNNGIIGRDHQYGYNGKEEQNELSLSWSDYGWRNYDASLGRWINVDIYAEKYSPVSPYVYVANNPIFLLDPNGKEILLGRNTINDRELSQQEINQILSALSEITDDKLKYDKKTGRVIIDKKGKGDKTVGTNLLRSIIGDKKQLTINMNRDEETNVGQIGASSGSSKGVDEDDPNFYNGIGGNVTISLGFGHDIFSQDFNGGATIREELTDTDMMNHELGHAFAQMKGESKRGKNQSIYYTDPEGVNRVEIIPIEEAVNIFVDFRRISKKGIVYPSENTLRKEQGKRKRVNYHTTFQKNKKKN
ncbi:DUF6443 domain-containing protein [Kordia zhangzhouensis]|uniref:DUF6443 domain-containing protein n=1 Tax=Kordia zhangzhouensis TaxID=1620405 RepID=UPI00069BE60D|nr:RHS repeat-associated core domain-containing protein [Kordia zhangzhouensis]